MRYVDIFAFYIEMLVFKLTFLSDNLNLFKTRISLFSENKNSINRKLFYGGMFSICFKVC